MSWMQPPDPPEDPRDDSERWEEAFKLMEDERAEFEAAFRDLAYCMTRTKGATSAFTDYWSIDTAHAWHGWLQHARVQWMPAP